MMEKPSPAMRRALRQAQLYRYLVVRNDWLYHPGGNQPVCSLQTGLEMVRSGWLIVRDGRYEITPDGLHALDLPRLPQARQTNRRYEAAFQLEPTVGRNDGLSVGFTRLLSCSPASSVWPGPKPTWPKPLSTPPRAGLD
jgi:hypothetical protein